MGLLKLARIIVDVILEPDSRGTVSGDKKTRGSGRSATERKAIREEQFWASLEKRDPHRWMELMERQLGLGDRDQLDPFEAYLQMRQKMRAAGLEPAGEGGGSIWRDLLQALPGAVQVLQAGQHSAPNSPPAPAPIPLPPPATPATPIESAPPQPRPLPLGEALYDAAYTRNPAEMTAWLLANQERYPELKQFLPQLAAVPDEMIPMAIERIRPGAPTFADFLERNQDWTKELLAEIRTQLGAAP